MLQYGQYAQVWSKKVFLKMLKLDKKVVRRSKCTDKFHLNAELGYIPSPLLP